MTIGNSWSMGVIWSSKMSFIFIYILSSSKQVHWLQKCFISLQKHLSALIMLYKYFYLWMLSLMSLVFLFRNVPLQACLHKVPVDESQWGSQWLEQWPLRLEKPPYWLSSQTGVYRKGALEDFTADYKHWKNVVSHSIWMGWELMVFCEECYGHESCIYGG